MAAASQVEIHLACEIACLMSTCFRIGLVLFVQYIQEIKVGRCSMSTKNIKHIYYLLPQ